MKFKKIFLMLLISLLIIPSNTLAYSNKLIVGGQNIGIEVKTKGILVVGMYKVNDEFISESSGLEKGDYITKVNGDFIRNIGDFTNAIKNDDDREEIDIDYVRNGRMYTTKLKVREYNGELKTGLYVKDSISGIGTLTFIDPETKIYGALGHEIQDKNSNNILDIDDGSIYKSNITGIAKSSSGNPGAKEATVDSNEKFGDISENTTKGIFGNYTGQLDDSNYFQVASPDEIKLGDASIYTVLDGEEIGSYRINIDNINMKDSSKNIIFTIKDPKLLEKTGGIVQGMSGSPIIQNGKIIGAVTHVIVNDCKRGYGIFITNMLEEAEEKRT